MRTPGLSSFPLTFIGLMLVVLSLMSAPWPPDFVNRQPFQTASHQERLTGEDAPPGLTVERRPGYALYRVLDGLVYLAVAEIVLGTLALILTGRRILLLVQTFAALYGMLYAAGLGLVIGPQLAFFGFGCIFFATGLGWVTSLPRDNDESESHSFA